MIKTDQNYPSWLLLGGNTHRLEKIRRGNGLVCLSSSYGYENAIQQVLTWQKKQKDTNYKPLVGLYRFGSDINRPSDAIKSFLFKIKSFGNSECKQLPSIPGIMDAMLELENLEGKCTDLGGTIYAEPHIEPVEVVIGKQRRH